MGCCCSNAESQGQKRVEHTAASDGASRASRRSRKSQKSNRGYSSASLRPLQRHREGSRHAQLHSRAQESLRSMEYRQAVKVPQGASQSVWIATHVVDFFNSVSILFGAVLDSCTDTSCPVMRAGKRFEYVLPPHSVQGHGTGSEDGRVSARSYITYWMLRIEEQMKRGDFDDKDASDKIVLSAFARFFRIFAHLFHHHFNIFVELEAQEHLEKSFKHFYFFCSEFKLLNEREQRPLRDLIERLEQENPRKRAS
ncbi:MAG: hypothetical protein MHM6MM_000357 [Cercozoa sp. M6MM]